MRSAHPTPVPRIPRAPPALRPPPLDRSRHAAPQVIEYLRGRIIALEFPPGLVLSRGELATQFGLSQTPVRDALMRLEEEGLVDIFAQHKTVVSRVDIGAALQAQFLRSAIEVDVARALAQARDVTLIKSLRETIAAQKAALGSGSLADFFANDMLFHRQMYAAAGVPDLWDVVRRHSGHIDRLRRMHLPLPGKAPQILKDHARILDGIARGDAAAAEASVRAHLSDTLSRVDQIRVRYPAYVTN